MNTVQLSLHQLKKLRKYLFSFAPKEAAAFIISEFFRDKEGIRFVARELMLPDVKDYCVQNEEGLDLFSDFIDRVVSKAEGENRTVIFCHSHPFATDKLSYSPFDDFSEKVLLCDYMEGKPVGSLLFGQSKIIGGVWFSLEEFPEIVHQIRLVGRHRTTILWLR